MRGMFSGCWFIPPKTNRQREVIKRMKEFAYGTDDKFRVLNLTLSEGKIYKFANRQLPNGCTPNTACLWFGKVDDSYKICIDRGIVTTKGSEEFKSFLKNGGASFASMNSMVNFLHSLKPLFQSESQNNVVETESGVSDLLDRASNTSITDVSDTDSSNVIDKGRLNLIRSRHHEVKQVWPENIAERLKQKIYGQDEVIDILSDLIVINKMRTNKKLLVVTFLGPTATGKSETAKSLADVMSSEYGKHYGYIEIAGSEFIGEHTVHRFFGAPPGFVGHGEPTILEPVRKNPFHVIVINEIEKADEKILIGLMEAIDTGYLGMADNTTPINLNDCVLILTSNIQLDMTKYERLSSFERSELCRDAFTKQCGRPEISGKIGNFLVFKSLSEEALTDIIIKFIKEELNSYDLVLAHIDEFLMADFLKQRTKYGARGIRGIVNEAVGRHLLKNRNISKLKGKHISLTGSIDNISIEEIKEDENEEEI